MRKERPPINELDENMNLMSEVNQSIIWHDPTEAPFRLSGFAWYKQDRVYRRLPVRPHHTISAELHALADCTAGGQIQFRTTASRIVIKVKLDGVANMNHMPSTAQCGFDCYIGEVKQQQFVSVTMYDHHQSEYEITLIEREKHDAIDVTLNFPLYMGVESVLIGLNEQARVSPFPDYERDDRIIFYGTSITQGGCASRPGMAYPTILSRRFNLECINLGFSGNGKGEANMAKIIAEIKNPALLVLDYEPNCMSTALYKETLPQFIETYRKVHENVPILLVSKFPYAGENVNPELRKDRLERLEFQKTLVKRLVAEGDQSLYFLDGTTMLGEHTNAGTVDGIHPTDLGFMQIAKTFEPIISDILDL